MQKKIYHVGLLALVLSLALFTSGCAGASKKVSIENVQKTFKSDIDSNLLKTSILKAAQLNDWELVSEKPNSSTLQFKKTFTKARRHTSPSKRWKKYIIEKDIYIHVDIEKDTLNIKLLKGDVEFLSFNSVREKFNTDLEALKKSIYVGLVQ